MSDRFGRDRYRAALTALEWTQEDAAQWLGISHTTSQRYANGRARIPFSVAAILRRLVKYRLTKPNRDYQQELKDLLNF